MMMYSFKEDYYTSRKGTRALRVTKQRQYRHQVTAFG